MRWADLQGLSVRETKRKLEEEDQKWLFEKVQRLRPRVILGTEPVQAHVEGAEGTQDGDGDVVMGDVETGLEEKKEWEEWTEEEVQEKCNEWAEMLLAPWTERAERETVGRKRKRDTGKGEEECMVGDIVEGMEPDVYLEESKIEAMADILLRAVEEALGEGKRCEAKATGKRKRGVEGADPRKSQVL